MTTNASARRKSSNFIPNISVIVPELEPEKLLQ
jgi:hypothetical protein